MEDQLNNITPEKVSLIKVFATSFAISSIAGLARLLRSHPSDKAIPTRVYFSALLNSGIFGLIVALLWFHAYSDNLTFLIGVSTLAGIGGVSIIDFVVLFIKKRIGIKIEVVDTKEPDEDESQSDKHTN